jgi:hypothetical protein
MKNKIIFKGVILVFFLFIFLKSKSQDFNLEDIIQFKPLRIENLEMLLLSKGFHEIEFDKSEYKTPNSKTFRYSNFFDLVHYSEISFHLVENNGNFFIDNIEYRFNRDRLFDKINNELNQKGFKKVNCYENDSGSISCHYIKLNTQIETREEIMAISNMWEIGKYSISINFK